MNQDKIDLLQRNLKREKAARIAAEKIAENKHNDLYLSEELKKTNLALENLLEQKSSQLEGVFENINDGYILIDMFGNIVKMNDIATDFFGYNIEKEKCNVSNLIYPEDLEYGIRSFNILKEKGVFTNYRTRILSKDKRVKWVQINGNVIVDKENKPTGAQGIIRDITSEKKAEDLLIESENRLSSVIKNLESAVLLEDENRKIILVNNKFCELFNIPISPNLLKGEDCSSAANDSKSLFKHPEEFTSRVTSILEIKQQVLGDELSMVDGKILERDFIPILKGEQYKGNLWTYKDITLRKKYRESLEVQKENYSNIIANMNLGLVELNTYDEILFVNQSFLQMSGYSQKELLGKKAKEVFEPVYDADSTKTEKDKLNKSESNSYEFKIKNKSGAIRNLLVSGAPNYNIKGNSIGFIEIYLDVTEARKNAQLIQEKKEELDTIVNNSSIGIALTRHGRIIRTNAALQYMLGFSETELNTFAIRDLSFAEDSHSFKLYIEQITANEIDNFTFTKRYKKKDGSVIWTKTNVNVVRDKDGNIKHQVTFIEDITSNREKTLIIDLINNLTKSILGKTDIVEIAWEIVNNIAAYLDSDDCVIYLVDHEKETTEQIAVYGSKLNDDNTIINKLFIQKGTGIVGSVAKSGKSELINDTSKDDRYVKDDERRFSEITVPIVSNGIVIGIIDSEHKDKNHYTEEHIKTLESIASLAAIKLRTAISIREHKKVEHRNQQLLVKLEKSNNELNEYAHIVSHDLKSPLRSIDALVSWIKMDNEGLFDESTLQNFDLIEDTLEKMEQLISDILFYSSIDGTASEKRDVNLNIVLENVQKIIFIPENITVRVLNKLPSVRGDKIKFQQLFQNLISNAIKFNDKKKGIVQIDVLENKSFYQFSVKDNGIGIEKVYVDKIFKLFHSLKANKESSGIGLSIVKKIVYLYQGEIWIESKPKIGTTFYFTLKK
ncbi:PAS domain S-box protein [Maribacter antarcticus]|uniref:PAS domain S-box protein n=1 Tax=Maribacter antarcticus TaxID=505250 RepID=UPI00047A3928|nr:PAS domain S-box protein [Maribacter antarcticus]